MTQPTLFDGSTFSPSLDSARLTGLLLRVREALRDGQWWTLADLVASCGGSEAGVSARLRDLRKPRFGGHKIEGRRVDIIGGKAGLWEYRMVNDGN